MVLAVYRSAMDAKKNELKVAREALFQGRAEEEKKDLLKAIAATVPIFWSHYQEDLALGNPAWWNADTDGVGSKYGIPGVVIWGHLFIGRWRDSDTYRLHIGSWPSQLAYTNESKPGKIECRPLISIEAMNEQRYAIEKAFMDSVEGAISVITSSGNQSSFENWTGPESQR